MYVEKLTDEQLKKLISPKFSEVLSNFVKKKWNGRLYISYNCYSFACETVLEDFRVVFSDFAISDLDFRRFMLSIFKKDGYFEDCARFIKNVKQAETKEDINDLKAGIV